MIECTGYKYTEDGDHRKQYYSLRNLEIGCMNNLMVKFLFESAGKKSESLVANIKKEIGEFRDHVFPDTIIAAFDAIELWIDYKIEMRRDICEHPDILKAIWEIAYMGGEMSNHAIKLIATYLKGDNDDITIALAFARWCPIREDGPILKNNRPFSPPANHVMWTRNWLTIMSEMVRQAYFRKQRSLWRMMHADLCAIIAQNVQSIIDSLAEFVVDSDFEFSSAAMRVIAVMISSNDSNISNATYAAVKEKGINLVEGLCNIIQAQEDLSELAIALACILDRELAIGIDENTQAELISAVEVLGAEGPLAFTEKGRDAVMWLTRKCSELGK